MRRLAWSLWALTIAFAAVGGAFVLTSLDARVPDNWGFRGYWDLVAPVFATAGLLVARRQPRNSIGWLLLLAGLTTGYGGFAQEYAIHAVIVAPGSLPGAVAVAWLASWTWTFSSGPLLTLVPQLFPTGQPISPRWRPLVWAGASFIPLAFVIFTLRPGPIENATFLENPLPATGAVAAFRDLILVPAPPLMAGVVLASAASMIVRFRRARNVERQQLKWMVSAAMLCGLAFVSMIVTNTSKASEIAMVAALTTVPVAMGLAIRRYRLYDIDLVINRALVYAPTTAAIAVAFFAGIVVLQAVLRPLTGGSEVAVAVSTLASVALFQPLRVLVQRAVDRRFYRSRYDAARILDDFSVRLRDQVALDAVRADLLDAVRETVQPAHASVWLREGR